MAERITMVTPVGRIVAGDLWEPRTTDFQGNPLKYKTGPNAGQDRSEYFIALAIPKNDPQWPAIHQAIYKEAMRGFPHLFDQQGNFQGQKFAWKFVDGDSTLLNSNNVRPCDKEGYPGHWVLSLASTIAPKVYDRNNQQIDPATKAVKRGDYVRVQISFVANEQPQNPGIYMGANMVQFSHQGEEITSGPDAATVFGATPLPAAPVGANTTPQPSLNPMPTGTVGAAPNVPGSITPPPVNAPNPVATAPNPVAAPAPANVTPAPDFLNGPAVTPPPAAPEKFLINGQAYTREQLLAANWTNEQINAQPRA
ncbi:hypothetical protein Scuro_35 [Acinetobacter phage Scuro]|nr:hypothetical protein Scuro_35 [Acinetobacter phage Scuro]